MPPQTRDAAVRTAAARIARLPQENGQRVIVGVAGAPGSGKTTVAAELRDAVNEASGAAVCAAVPMDGFHYTKAQLSQMPNAAEAFARRGAHWTFDAALLRRALTAARAGGETRLPGFDHSRGDPDPDALCVPASCHVLIVEGNYMLYDGAAPWDQVASLCDYKVYVDCPLEVSTRRLTRRHMAAWGIGEAEAYARASGSDYQNALLVATTRPAADFVIPNGGDGAAPAAAAARL